MLTSRYKMITILLAFMLVFSSFVVEAHQHTSDGVNQHCSLCFHHHNFSHAISTAEFNLAINKQTFISETPLLLSYVATVSRYYQSRAPPY